VRRALANARAQLAEPACRQVHDGSGTPDCRPAVAAATTRGRHVVLICADRFVRTCWPDGEVTLIHEMLHSLGLGENPPTSLKISRRVRMRCFDHLAQRKPSTR